MQDLSLFDTNSYIISYAFLNIGKVWIIFK